MSQSKKKDQDRPRCCPESFDQDDELRDSAEYTDHTRNADHLNHLQQPENSGAAHIETSTVRQDIDDKSQYPGFCDHHRNQQEVKHKPAVAEGILLFLEGQETNNQLERVVTAESVLRDNENGVCREECLCFVFVDINCYPHRVENDYGQRNILKKITCCYFLCAACSMIHIMHVVLRLDEGSSQLRLHGFLVCEGCLRVLGFLGSCLCSGLTLESCRTLRHHCFDLWSRLRLLGLLVSLQPGINREFRVRL